MYIRSINRRLDCRSVVPSRRPDVRQCAFTLGVGERRRQLRHAGRQTPKLFVGEYQQTCPLDRRNCPARQSIISLALPLPLRAISLKCVTSLFINAAACLNDTN